MLFISSELLVTDVSFDVCDLTLLHISLLWLFFCTFQEAIEKKEQRAKRFHFRSEVNLAQRNVALDRDMMKKGTGCLGGVFHSFPCHDLALLASPHMELVNLPLLRWPVNEELHQLCLSVLCVCVCVCVFIWLCQDFQETILSKEPQRTSWSWWQIGDQNCGSVGLLLIFCFIVHFSLPLRMCILSLWYFLGSGSI